MKRKCKNIKINSTVASLFKYLFGFIFLSIDIALTLLLRNKSIKWEWIWLPLIGVSFAAMWYLMGSEFIKGNKVLGKLFYIIILIWYLIRGVIVTKCLFGEETFRFRFDEMFWRTVLNSVGIFFIIPVLFNFTVNIGKVTSYIFIIAILFADFAITYLFKDESEKWSFLWLPLISFGIQFINGLIFRIAADNLEGAFDNFFGKMLLIITMLYVILIRSGIVAFSYFGDYKGCFVVSRSIIVFFLNSFGSYCGFCILGVAALE